MHTESSKSLSRNLLLTALLCAFFLTFPFRVQAETFANPLANTTPAECLFNWAEKNYPALFAPAGSTQFWTVYTYRYYPATNTYLGVNSINNHVYYLGQDGMLQDVGPLADWTPKAGCLVPQPSPAECLFNWAEQNYPGLFAPSGAPWAVSSIDWTYRYYALTNAYLGIQSIDNHVYYLDPDGNFQDEGTLADWTPKVSCRPPAANAGPDQTATVGATVTLDGSASTDLDGNLITYHWTLTQKPAGSQTGLLNPTALHPTLAIDKPGTYVISLAVNDGQFDSVPATVTINTQNSKPVSNAGTAQSGKVGDTLVLDGSASHDVDGDALTYHWTLPAKPQNSSAQLNNPDTVSPGLTLDKPGSYTAQLTVNDGKAGSDPATVVLSTVNSKPVAKAGPAQSLMLTTPAPSVLLDGSGSFDADNDPLSFRWALISKPAGSLSVLLDSLAPSARFSPDFVGDYVAQLIVNDGQFDSVPAIVTINTQNSKPVANAGPTQSGKVGDTLVLDGSASHDVDGDALSYHWTLPVKPLNSSAQLNNPDAVSPGLTLDKPGNYTAQLTVNDGKADSTPATVVFSTVNSKPLAKAGPAQSILLTTPAPSVLLNGNSSADADSDPLSFHWALISRPAGSLSVLLDPLAPISRFTPDFVGDYVAQLIVNDGHVDSDPNTVQITATAPPPPQNHPPQISTSPVLMATVGDSYSYDVDAVDSDNDTLTYSLIVLPSGMAIDAQTGLISWTPTVGQTGPQAVTVNVIDGKGGSDSQSFTITVAAAGQQTTVPDLRDLSRAAAEIAIQQAKLNLGTLSFEHNAKADGSVINQSPAANSSVAEGATVNLTISLGPDQGLSPNPQNGSSGN